MMSNMDVYEIRRRNLAHLVSEQDGTIINLARRTGTSANYLTQVLSETTLRHMGAKVARRIESSLDLPDGWMDKITGTPASLSEEAIALAQKFDRLPPAMKSKLASEIDVLTRYVSLED